MSGVTVGYVILVIIILAILIAIGVWLLSWLYRRSSKETAFARTGFGGQKVVMNGGALVLPIVHDVIPVNMNTLKLEVRRGRDSAVITRDRMRVDLVADFYVRVQSTPEAIANAAQTLGQRTMQPEALRELIEGKFVDALRAVAAEMSMEELHEKRGAFMRRVRDAVAPDVLKNGLEVESVSLTSLDQTHMEFFNPQNAFDAEGLTRLTDEIERRKKVRNDIEQDTLIQIRNKNLETEKLSLEIDRDAEYARLEQERELEIRRAVQRAELVRERSDREREAEQAQLRARQEVERARIAVERALDEERITRERETERLEIERRQTVELAEQGRAIAIAEQSRAQSEALAEADEARAKAVAAEERVFSARETEIAERRKQIELIQAAQEAEQEALRARVSAEADRLAAGDRAAARRIEAEGEAEAEKIRAVAARIRHEVDAEGMRLMNEAQNILTPESRASAMRIRLIDKLDAIIRESVKPMERIEGIKILHVEGLGGGGGGRGEGVPDGRGSLADSVVNSALRYRAQAPLIDSLLKEIGLQGGDIGKIASALRQGPERQAAEGEHRDRALEEGH
jgi:uncharacterized membrane protein YqiK